MKTTSSFIPPMPGQPAQFYCPNCKGSFNATVPARSPFSFLRGIGGTRAKCPVCKKLCGLDPRIQY